MDVVWAFLDSLPWWVYLLGGIVVLSILGSFGKYQPACPHCDSQNTRFVKPFKEQNTDGDYHWVEIHECLDCHARFYG
jgi:hypothetical protein